MFTKKIFPLLILPCLLQVPHLTGSNKQEFIIKTETITTTTPFVNLNSQNPYAGMIDALSAAQKKALFKVLKNQLNLLFTLAAESLGIKAEIAVTTYDKLINTLRKKIDTATASLAESQDALLLLNHFDARCTSISPKIHHKLLNEMLKIRSESTSLVKEIVDYSIKQAPALEKKLYSPKPGEYARIDTLLCAPKELNKALPLTILNSEKFKNAQKKFTEYIAPLKYFSYVNSTLLDFKNSMLPLLKEYAYLLNELKKQSQENTSLKKEDLNHYIEITGLSELFLEYPLEKLKKIAQILSNFFEEIIAILKNSPAKEQSISSNPDENLIDAIKKHVLKNLTGESKFSSAYSEAEDTLNNASNISDLLKAISIINNELGGNKEELLKERLSCEHPKIFSLIESLKNNLCPSLYHLIAHQVPWKSENIGLLRGQTKTNQHFKFFSHTFTLAPFFIHLYHGIMIRIKKLEQNLILNENHSFDEQGEKQITEKKAQKQPKQNHKKKKLSNKNKRLNLTQEQDLIMDSQNPDPELERFDPLIIKQLLENKNQTTAESGKYFIFFTRWGSGIHSQATLVIEKTPQNNSPLSLWNIEIPHTKSLEKSDLFHKSAKKLLKQQSLFNHGQLVESPESAPDLCKKYHITLLNNRKALVFPGYLFLGANARKQFETIAKCTKNPNCDTVLGVILATISDTGKHKGAGVCIFKEDVSTEFPIKKLIHSCFHEEKQTQK